MKLNNINKKQAGLTLIEITLVIAVLLGLISVLFIGVKAYKEGSDRSKCILTISSVQKGVRSYQNLYELSEGAALVFDDLVGSGKMLETLPTCGSQGTIATGGTDQPDAASWGAGGYDGADVVPATGAPYLVCTDADKGFGTAGSTANGTPSDQTVHYPKTTEGW